MREKIITLMQIVVIIVLILSFIKFVRGSIDYSPDTCWNYSCNGYTEEFCCIECVDTVINYTNPVFVEIDVGCGETVESSKENCEYKVIAGNYTESSEKCSVTKSLDSGEDWSLTNSECDIFFNCGTEETDDEPELYNKTYTFPYTIQYDEETKKVDIRIMNKNISTEIGGNLYYSNTLEFQCPIGIVNDTTSDWTFQQCKDYLPYFFEMEDITKLMIASSNKCDLRLQSCMEEKGQLIAEKSGKVLVENNLRISEMGELTECKKLFNLQRNESERLNGKLGVCEYRLNSGEGGQSVLLGTLIIIGGYSIFVTVHSLRKRGRGGLQG